MARILCAMSGGVDSTVSALLLREAGHDVIGAFMRTGGPAVPGRGSARSCCGLPAARDASLAAATVGVPFHVVDCEADFARVIDHFVEEYHRGRTPNPCSRCNEWIKFGILLDYAWSLDCDGLATGHYARLERGPGGPPRLLRGRDPGKDQSYFLFAVRREALECALFPVGGLHKEEVREIARRKGLPVAEKPESQEICFVPGDYRDVLIARGPDRLRPGRFVDPSGRDLGWHGGHQRFTIGQRRGLPALGKPRYVVSLDPEKNEVVLGSREDLDVWAMVVEEVRWCSIPDPRQGDAIRSLVQIRHHHRPTPAFVKVEAPDRVRVEFEEPERAVAPGQAAVFYDGDLLLGGGWISGP
jgi:tRNA-uridine 2-sulfurtransferase